MRNLVLFTAFLFTFTIASQNNASGSGGTLNENIAQLASGEQFGNSMMFYNPKRQIDGKFHLFENWNNTAVIHTLSDDKFLVKRINLNLQRNSFESKMNDSDSIFSFTFNNIKKIVIGKAVYKNYYYNDDNRVYQMLYDSDKYKLLKGFEVKLITGSANPMVNRPNDKYVRGENYFIMIEGVISPIKLKKKSLYKTLDLDKSNTSRLNMFVESNSLSLKKEEDIVKLLEYYNTI
ncbi:MAG: hypothetical protein ACI8PF_000907 [Flavobacteriaceae bacterium]|jgi:hypothetical protein|tara:strand:- start:85 stop:786 length:702 start_codon:yes stop_codon:yes gene_type:complete